MYLTHLVNNPIDEFNLIYNSKRGINHAILTMKHNDIQIRYDDYQQAFYDNDLERINSVLYHPNSSSAMLHCYTSSTAALEDLLVRIKENQMLHLRSICHFCGINTDSTTDHYLPKDQFPEFCVNLLNLIPCCPDCNSYKGEYWLDNISLTRGIINLYTDDIPDIQFLFVDITYLGNVPIAEFTVDNRNNINPDLFDIISKHYQRLHLTDRYKDKFNSIYSQIHNLFLNKPMFTRRPDLIQDFLNQDVINHSNLFGVNHYKGVIMDSLANNIVFLNEF